MQLLQLKEPEVKANVTVEMRCIACGSEYVEISEEGDGYLIVACTQCKLMVKLGFIIKEVLTPGGEG